MYINEECIILVHKHDCEHNWGKGEIEIFKTGLGRNTMK